MKVIFLGTNGWYSSPTGDTPCILIDTKDEYVILDAGNGFYKLDGYIKEDKPVKLFISHFHIDHISGLHTLVKFDFKQGLDVYVGKGRSQDFKTFVNPPFTKSYASDKDLEKLNFEVRLHELSENSQNIPFKVQAIEQEHAFVDHGFRLQLEGKTVAYTGDCGLTENAKQLARNADFLIAECAWEEMINETWGHLNPERAATLAKDAGAKRLILTHFGADVFKTLDDRKRAEEKAKKIFPNTTAARDGMEFNL